MDSLTLEVHMSRRTVLRSQLTTAWREAIEEDYRSQRINSERSLQASLWSRLNSSSGKPTHVHRMDMGIGYGDAVR